MADDKKVKRQALALLKKARAWFKSEDRLVKDWDDAYETKSGDMLVHPKGACRACILGGLNVAIGGRPTSDAEFQAEAYLLSITFDARRPHTLIGVHRIYDRAIARLEKELQ